MRNKGFRTLIILAILACVAASPGFSQYARRIVPYATLPTNCNPLNGDVAYNTTTRGLYQCTATDTWSNVGLLNNFITFTQGTLTASTPFIQQSATWNNAAVAFTNLFTNVTNTASDAASLLFDFQVGGASIYSGDLTGNFTIASGGSFLFNARGGASAPADGVFVLTNAAGTNISRLTLGPNSIAGTAIVPDIVGGQTQGVIIANGDGTTVSFAELGAATNGAIIFCDDCTKATPCAGGGTGALAKRLNGGWDCD